MRDQCEADYKSSVFFHVYGFTPSYPLVNMYYPACIIIIINNNNNCNRPTDGLTEGNGKSPNFDNFMKQLLLVV